MNNAEVISKRVKEAQHTEAEINLAREKYKAVPQRGATLYFVMADLPLIDPMYQYSLEYFIRVFNHCVKNSPKSIDLPTRLRTLIDFTTEFVFTTVRAGLPSHLCHHLVHLVVDHCSRWLRTECAVNTAPCWE